MKKIITIIIAAAVIVAVGAFYSGMKYGQSSAQQEQQVKLQQFRNGGSGNGNSHLRGGVMNSGPVTGEIISKDDKSITLKLRDGGSKIVLFTSGTPITKNAAGSIEDLKVGEQINVINTVNQDGSVTAQSIQLKPIEPKPPVDPKK